MNCKICGTENPEDAVFCKACGKRLDGLETCGSCSATIPADSAFCPYCGVKQGQPQPTEKVTAAKAKTENKTAQKVLKYSAPVASLITAVFSLIFVFCIGLTKNGVTYGGSQVSSEKAGVDLFFYFGEAYKIISRNFDKLDQSGTGYSDYFAATSYLPAILGTVISAFTIIAVCTLAILAVVRGVKYLRGKTQKTGGSLAIGAFLAYLAGALALFAIDNYYVKTVEIYNYTQHTTIISCKLNPATLAGISLGAIFAIIYTGVTVASRGRELLKQNSIIKCALSLAGIALVITVIALCAKPAIYADSNENITNDKIQMGAMYLLAMMTIACMSWETSEAVLNLNEFTAFTVISFIMLIVTVVFATRALAGFSKNAAEKCSKSHLVVCALFAAFSLLFMVFTIVACKQFTEAAEYVDALGAGSGGSVDSDDLYFKYPLPIASFVLSVVTLGVGIAQYCLANKKTAAPAPAVVEAEND